MFIQGAAKIASKLFALACTYQAKTYLNYLIEHSLVKGHHLHEREISVLIILLILYRRRLVSATACVRVRVRVRARVRVR